MELTNKKNIEVLKKWLEQDEDYLKTLHQDECVTRANYEGKITAYKLALALLKGKI